MSLTAAEIAGLAALGAPVLCVDTCTLLDVVRDITLEPVRASDIRPGLDLLNVAETGAGLVVLMAEQVALELATSLPEIEQDAKRKVERYLAEAQRIQDVATLLGATGALQMPDLVGHLDRVGQVLNRWRQVAKHVPVNHAVTGRAFARVNAPRTPARKGKESMKDCVVAEAYLEVAGQLRAAGLTTPIVFASSNGKDYLAPNTPHVKVDFAEDLEVVGMAFASNLGAAKAKLQV